MNRKPVVRGSNVFCGASTFFCFFILLSFYASGHAAPAAAGLERHQKAGLSCGSCHKETPPKVSVLDSQCMACHGDLAKLVQKTNKTYPNPHASPHLNPGEQPKCEDCHHIHKPSVVSCISCHEEFKFKMP
ncbi:MAG: Fumarate reductase flavoprotein subunit [Syntrophus sp. SKADARSKE-3]|nr:Fumarate reductase flavoprotein subunit [Syntrophus sp. SKADARSKE-3]